MKSRLLLFGLLILTLIVYVVFKLNEDLVIERLAPHFPDSEENSPGYYADLVSFLFAESIALAVLVILSIYYSFSRTFLDQVQRVEGALLRNAQTALIGTVVVFLIITVLVATLALEQFPNSADEYAYLFQAEQLAEGKLWSDVHPVPDFFEFHHLAQKDGKWVGRFPPGWPMLLSLAFMLHVPAFLINVILATLSILVFHRLMRRLYDERIALWATLAMTFSSFFIFNAATYFSHIASLFEGLMFVYLCYRYLQTRKNSYVLGAGVFLGLLVMTRQLTALIFLLPFVVYFFYQLRWRALTPLILMALTSLPFAALFLWYNYAITGNAFVPVTMWTNADEALGFVKGHTPVKGLKFTFKRFAMFFYWASPSFLLLYFVFLGLRLKSIRRIILHPEDYIFLLLVVGYFFYYHSGGNQYGPRFYLEGFPFLIAFIALKSLRTNHRAAKVFLFFGLLFNVVKIPFIAHREHKVVEERKDVFAQVDRMNLSNAVVFISSGTGIMRPMPVEDLNRNDRYYRNTVIYARDLGDKNEALMEFYKDRDFYLYRRDEDSVQGELIRLPR